MIFVPELKPALSSWCSSISSGDEGAHQTKLDGLSLSNKNKSNTMVGPLHRGPTYPDQEVRCLHPGVQSQLCGTTGCSPGKRFDTQAPHPIRQEVRSLRRGQAISKCSNWCLHLGWGGLSNFPLRRKFNPAAAECTNNVLCKPERRRHSIRRALWSPNCSCFSGKLPTDLRQFSPTCKHILVAATKATFLPV